MSVEQPNIKSSESRIKSRSQGWTCSVRIQVQAFATKTWFSHPWKPQLLSDGWTPAFENWTNRLFAGKFHLNVEVHFLKRHQKQNNKINLMSAPETWYEIIKFQSEEKPEAKGLRGFLRRCTLAPFGDACKANLTTTSCEWIVVVGISSQFIRRAVNWVSLSPHSRDYPAPPYKSNQNNKPNEKLFGREEKPKHRRKFDNPEINSNFFKTLWARWGPGEMRESELSGEVMNNFCVANKWFPSFRRGNTKTHK